jgi:sugar O-acyltransferase (sialic acid O-acetyltransferase NeuD family)
MISKRLAILGASGHGKVTAEMALSNGWDSVDFYDDAFPHKATMDGFSIQGGLNSLLKKSHVYNGFHVAIGCNRTRQKILKQLVDLDLPCPNIIASSAVVSQSALLGKGISIMANVVVNAKTILGDGVILNTSCSVDHDCIIAAGAHISPGAHLAGDVSVGVCSWVGIGSAILQGKVIGENSIIGAGSVVINDFPNNVVAAGVPAKVIR